MKIEGNHGIAGLACAGFGRHLIVELSYRIDGEASAMARLISDADRNVSERLHLGSVK